jgi:hypothetical protein
MKYPWLYVGAKVTPVRFSGAGDPNAVKLRKGSVYTVREVLNCNWQGELVLGLRLEGISAGFGSNGIERAILASYFRPVSTIDTSKQIEALRKLVEPSNLPAKVDA